MGSIPIPLSSKKYPNLFTIIDEEDYDLVSQYTWVPQPHPRGFFAVTTMRINGKRCRVQMHRLLARAASGQQVDHINRNQLDNRRENLRLASAAQNGANRPKPANNTSGFKGVAFHRQSGRWRAEITVAKKRHSLGLHDTPEAAARAYDDAAKKHLGEFAFLNFPEEVER